jgi:predicted O-linked N-acetylglucosamine transferase (SPINDLY family)
MVEVYGYGNIAKPDQTTEFLKGKFDFYRNIFGMDTPSLVELIKNDKIDILVELAGHTNGNSLPALAYKPAPIQISYLGYPGTTGMTQIDYRMTDAIVNPQESQKYYTEQLLYLPHPFCCFDAANLPTTSLPAEHNGFITFGSFLNNCKINSDCMSLWANVLKHLKGSRIMLRFAQAENPEIKEFYFHQFENLGIERSRVDISGYIPYDEHLKKYQDVDIMLDTFPFNGHTTICEALSMGVPAISLTGETFASRLGLCMLKAVGLEFFAAQTKDEYIKKATALAQNIPSLSKIRATMRQRMQVSPLFNSKTFAANVENVYRKIWHHWCNSRSKTN